MARTVNQDSRWRRMGHFALNEVKLLPYEIPALFVSYSSGADLGEHISKNFFPVPPDPFPFGRLGQGLQDVQFRLVGGTAIAILAFIAARNLGRHINSLGTHQKTNTKSRE